MTDPRFGLLGRTVGVDVDVDVDVKDGPGHVSLEELITSNIIKHCPHKTLHKRPQGKARPCPLTHRLRVSRAAALSSAALHLRRADSIVCTHS